MSLTFLCSLNFDDTYDGLGERLQEAGDDFNEDTFGGGAEGTTGQGAVGKDFDFFGNTAQVSNAIDEESVRYSLQRPSQHVAAGQQQPTKPKRTGYEKYQDPGYIPEIQAKSGAWGSKAQTAVPQRWTVGLVPLDLLHNLRSLRLCQLLHLHLLPRRLRHQYLSRL